MAWSDVFRDVGGTLAGAGAGFLAGGPVGAGIGAGLGLFGAIEAGKQPDAPTLTGPSALSSTPTQAEAADKAVASNLNNEQAIAAGAIPSTAAMLTDRESYKSTSTLLGA